MDNHYLHIYKASAGSGKTFTLAVNYISMLIEKPDAYRNILAVTFTNKATAEMKQRIISKLYGIAHGTDDALPYLEKVKETTGLAERVIRERARTALQLLVHDYGHFRIETIDSFFQSVLRGLARELDLGTGMTIELDTKKVISEAVDYLLRELKPNDATLQWITDYVIEEIGEGKQWNITDNLKAFARNIHNEDYQHHAETLRKQLKDTALIRTLRTNLRTERANAKKRIEERAADFFRIIKENNLTIEDFAYSYTGPCSYYIKLSKGQYVSELGSRAQAAAESAEGWTSKSSSRKDEIMALAHSQLVDHINETQRICAECITVINSCELILYHLNQLQLINIIHDHVLQLNREENRFLLADTCQMLSRMQTGDSAFVFEKLGYYIRHIMIDEFQDTSRMQWDNFFPLLLEGLSHGNKSLIVGDVKQAIYRWRGSDWRILNEEITRVLGNYTPSAAHRLDTNRRSLEGIVSFNNRLFSECNNLFTELLGQQKAAPLIQAYSDVEQQWNPENEGGYVRVRSVQHEEGETQPDAMCREVASIIGELRCAGVADNQIAILVRSNKKIAHMVDYMAKHHTDTHIFSAEAYLLDASTAVCMLISALRWIADERHLPALIELAFDYHRYIKASDIGPAEILALADEGYGLPQELIVQHARLRQTPLYELGEKLYRLLGLEALTEETGYVMAFFDHLLKYCSDSTGDINNLLTYWDDELHATAIPGGAAGGIEAMTIHKSKGLEFHTVILPYCEWELNKHKGTLWVSTDDPLAAGLAAIPVTYTQKMPHSIFAAEYDDEELKQAVDNYNLLYVACTRPKCNLFILKSGEKKKEEKQSGKKRESTSPPPINTVSRLISRALEMADKDTLEYGTLVGSPPHKPHTVVATRRTNRLEATATPISVTMHSEPLSVRFRQSNLSRRYISTVTADTAAITTQHYIEQGMLLHDVFSRMATAADAPDAIHTLLQSGLIATGKELDEITRIVYRALEHPEAAEWFSGKYQLFAECTILYPDAEGMVKQMRPDRVMSDGHRMIVVDFKFARPDSEHHHQVSRYMEQLNAMGHTHVEGYVWYVYEGKVVPVGESEE